MQNFCNSSALVVVQCKGCIKHFVKHKSYQWHNQWGVGEVVTPPPTFGMTTSNFGMTSPILV